MKHIHFFGCSFTVGDEIIDDEYFPWINECQTQDEYFERRSKEFIFRKMDSYWDQCKQYAYPELLKNSEIQTYNHARCGSSVREIFYKILAHLDSKEPTDAIVFQIPPYPREVYIDKESVDSVQLSMFRDPGVNLKLKKINDYKSFKITSHDSCHWAVEDLVDILSVNSIVKQANIPLYFLDLNPDLNNRFKEVPRHSQHILRQVSSMPNIIHFSMLMFESDRRIGRHFNKMGHKKIAALLRNHITELQ